MIRNVNHSGEIRPHKDFSFKANSKTFDITSDFLWPTCAIYFFFPGDANHVLHLQAFIVSHRVTQKPHRGPFPISMLKLFRSDRERPHRATPRTAPPPRDQTLPSSDQVIRLLSSVHLRGAGVVIRSLDVTSKKGPERQTRICSSLKSRANRGDKNETRVLIYQRRAAD